MGRTHMLRTQHDRAEELASDLLLHIERHDRESDCFPVAMTLAKLLGLLKLHLAQEDRVLYPEILSSEDPELAATARRFKDEMGGLAVALDQFARRWQSSAAIDERFRDFSIETGDILTKLGERIRRENEELYPMVDEHFEQMQMPAQG